MTVQTIDIGGDLTVNRSGFGAMRITGRGIWADPPDKDVAIAVLSFAVHLLFSPLLLVAVAVLAWIKFRPRRSRQ